MRIYRIASLLILILLSASCASKTQIGDIATPGAGQESVDPELSAKIPAHAGSTVLTPQEYRALQSQGAIRFENSAYAQEKIREQFLFLSRDVRYKLEVWIERSRNYLPYAKKVFAERGLPQDLIFLPFIESGYNPKAYSSSGAAGCWQFMPFTGRRFGLSVDWWVDERRDPYKSAHAAADYLTKLHEMFGDWSLAIAAYNAGEGKIGRALKASGATTFFELAQRNHTLDGKLALREETLNYLPRFAAMVKIAYNLELLGLPGLRWDQTPDLQRMEVPGGLDLRQLAEASHMSWDDFEKHNPSFRRESTPPARASVVYVPRASLASVQRYVNTPASRKGNSYHQYTVKRGDSWSIIAQRYGQDVATLKRVNKRSSNLLHPGQKIIVPTSAAARIATSKESSPAPAPRYQETPRSVVAAKKTHTVRAGDTLFSLSKRYNCSVAELQALNSIASPRDLRVGMHLRIPGHGAVAQSSGNTGSSRTVYRVRSGDTVWSIARSFQVSPWKLLEWNNLDRAAVIQPGDLISLYR